MFLRAVETSPNPQELPHIFENKVITLIPTYLTYIHIIYRAKNSYILLNSAPFKESVCFWNWRKQESKMPKKAKNNISKKRGGRKPKNKSNPNMSNSSDVENIGQKITTENEQSDEFNEFSCDMCDKEFSQMPLLEAHIMDEHLRNQIKSKIEPDQEVENDIKQESEPKSIRQKVVLKKQSESKITCIIFENNK